MLEEPIHKNIIGIIFKMMIMRGDAQSEKFKTNKYFAEYGW